MDCNLVLSGGGARGFAHLGVVKALQVKKINFSAISATSSGAMIAAFLCDGYTVDEITEIIRSTTPITKLNLHFTQGLMTIETLDHIFNKYLRSKTFEGLKFPLYVSATDLNSGNQVVFKSGDIAEAVIASSSIPILFPTAAINGKPYVDGGVSANLPAEPFVGSRLKTIGVHVNPIDNYDASLSMMRQFERALHLIIRANVVRDVEKIDLLIEPDELKDYGLFDTKKMDEMIKIGYDHVMEKVDLNKLSAS